MKIKISKKYFLFSLAILFGVFFSGANVFATSTYSEYWGSGENPVIGNAAYSLFLPSGQQPYRFRVGYDTVAPLLQSELVFSNNEITYVDQQSNIFACFNGYGVPQKCTLWAKSATGYSSLSDGSLEMYLPDDYQNYNYDRVGINVSYSCQFGLSGSQNVYSNYENPQGDFNCGNYLYGYRGGNAAIGGGISSFYIQAWGRSVSIDSFDVSRTTATVGQSIDVTWSTDWAIALRSPDLSVTGPVTCNRTGNIDQSQTSESSSNNAPITCTAIGVGTATFTLTAEGPADGGVPKTLTSTKTVTISTPPIIPIPGCTNPSATNYNSNATVDDGSCNTGNVILGCTNPSATNYNSNATPGNAQANNCTFPIYGCMDSNAINYDPSATRDHTPSDCSYPPSSPPGNFSIGGGCYGWSSPQGDVGLYDTSQNADTYDLERKINSSSWSTITSGVPASQWTSLNHAESVTANSTYYWRVKANNENGYTYSNTLSYLVNASNCGGSAPVEGCTDPNANNYNSEATQNDGSCSYVGVRGCTDSGALNYNPSATENDGSCVFTGVLGCTVQSATNYNPLATVNDGSCTYPSSWSCTASASPSSGQSPLNGVDITINGVGDNASNNSIDCTNNGSYEVDSQTSTAYPPVYTIADACNYASDGEYTIKVKRQQLGGAGDVAYCTTAVSVGNANTLTIVGNPGPGGKISSFDNKINCGTLGSLNYSTCTASYSQGAVTTLSAVPSSSYWQFSGWSTGTAGECTGVGLCTLNITAPKTVTATFIVRPFSYIEF